MTLVRQYVSRCGVDEVLSLLKLMAAGISLLTAVSTH